MNRADAEASNRCTHCHTASRAARSDGSAHGYSSAPNETASLNEALGCSSGNALPKVAVVAKVRAAMNPAGRFRNFMAISNRPAEFVPNGRSWCM
jgi:hypothetical protein